LRRWGRIPSINFAEARRNTNQIQNSILAQVAQQDIESAMASKGLQKVPESQTPDLILTASGGESEQTSWNARSTEGANPPSR
jgi:hypothetical protein